MYSGGVRVANLSVLCNVLCFVLFVFVLCFVCRMLPVSVWIPCPFGFLLTRLLFTKPDDDYKMMNILLNKIFF